MPCYSASLRFTVRPVQGREKQGLAFGNGAKVLSDRRTIPAGSPGKRNRGKSAKGRSGSEPVLPVSRLAVEVHHGENPDVGRTLDIDDAIGEFAGEMPPGRLADEAEGAG